MEKCKRLIELRNGVRVPIIGLGTSLRGKPKIDNQAFIDSVKHAIQIGYRHIDTVKNKTKFLCFSINMTYCFNRLNVTITNK